MRWMKWNENLKWIVESQSTDIEALNREIVSLKQKMERKGPQIDNQRAIKTSSRNVQIRPRTRWKISDGLMHVQEQEIQANQSKLAEIEIKLQGMNKIVEKIEIYGAEMYIY